MALTIRPACSQDLEQILELQQQAIQVLCSRDYGPHQLDAIILSQQQVRGLSELILLAENEQDLVGFSTALLPSWEIGGVYVHPDYTRQGIATQLLTDLERQAIKQRKRKLSVMSSLTAVAFYQSLGFQVIRKSTFLMHGVWIPCVAMEKLIALPYHQRRWRMHPLVLWCCGFILVSLVATLLLTLL
jgi:putative acetyltransferase